MQTFLPYANFHRSAAVLDKKRLGKQRVEVLQLLNALLPEGVGQGKIGWANHPAARMWKGHELVLVDYGVTICEQWTAYGYDDTCLKKIQLKAAEFLDHADDEHLLTIYRQPLWLGMSEFHRSHRSNLVRKDPNHYLGFWPRMPINLPYVWPVEAEQGS